MSSSDIVDEDIMLTIEPTLYDASEFIKASQVGDIDTVKELLNNVDPTAFDNQAYHQALMYGHHHIVDLLVEDPRVMNSLLRDGAQNIPLTPPEQAMKDSGCSRSQYLNEETA